MMSEFEKKYKISIDADKFADQMTKRVIKSLFGIDIKSPDEYRAELEKKLKKAEKKFGLGFTATSMNRKDDD